MGDIFTFFIIAVFIYNLFAKKDKPPQRRPGSAGERRMPPQPVTQQAKPLTSTESRKKKEGIFESLERQIRESAERLEQELQGGKTVPQKPATAGSSKRIKQYRNSSGTRTARGYQETEGVWGEEGRSDYDQYVSSQGTQGSEGTSGREGTPGREGSYGSEGIAPQKGKMSAIELAQIGGSPIYSRKEPSAGSLVFSPSEIVQGIIWAEVLKEPRGKRALSRR